MSVSARTKEYAVEVAEAALNSFDRQVRGSLSAPSGDENVRLFTAKGGSAVTLDSTTTSAAVVFDPEASLRNGQLSVNIFERNSAGVVKFTKNVSLGRRTEEFLSAGVMSSGLKVFNSSGVDVIGGTQTAAVLSSIPRKIATISTTDVANFCSNHERDLASGVVSRDDSTLTMAMTEHFGRKMALSRVNTLANVVTRTWDDGIGTRQSTTGSTLTFTGNTALSTTSSEATDADVLADTSVGDLYRVIDSDRLTEANNPLTLATYSASVTAQLHYNDPDVTAPAQYFKYTMYGLDAANNILASRDVEVRMAVTDNSQYVMDLNGTVTSSTLPIARVVVALKRNYNTATTTLVGQVTTVILSATEETADISARPVHVCVLEGLNASATLNIASTVVLTGVPDAGNVFISSGSTASISEVYDNNAVDIFLRTLSRNLPRAFTVGGHGVVERDLHTMYGDDEITFAFKAMSFDSVGRHVSKIAKRAKTGANEALMLLKEAAPVIEKISTALTMIPGPAQEVGGAGLALSRMIR